MANLAKNFKKNFDKKWDNYKDRMKQVIKDEAPRKSGALVDSITDEDVGQWDTLIGVDVSKLTSDARNAGGYDYSTVVYYGNRRGYRIYSKTGKILRWIGADGTVHFAYSVYHPPSSPNKFIDRAVQNRPRFD